ncbi:MAG: phenylacetate--CoA ligase family protein [Deltaproteobacteria bacterium]|nr:phenylacetate--CoA ligase family protein [Deltaproteobacteria bacterium]
MNYVHGALYRNVLFPLYEEKTRGRPTLKRLRYLERSQWFSLDELTSIQSEELQKLLEHAWNAVPFYRQRLEQAGVGPTDVRTPEDLSQIPVMTRAEAQSSVEQRTSTRPPFPTIFKTTGGSTGQPLPIGYDYESEYWRLALKLRGYGWAGNRIGDKTLYYWGEPVKPRPLHARAKMALDRALRRDIYVNCTPRSEKDLLAVIQLIRRDRPSAIACYTQAGVALARFVLDQGLRTWGTIPVICAAERLFPADRKILEDAFGPSVFETYGCRETMLVAAECEAHAGLHVSMENLIVEILVNQEGQYRPAAPGEVGEVVLTDLHNLGMPFIRYAIGDLAMAGPRDRCACGRALVRMSSIEGRTADTLRDASGEHVSGLLFTLIFSPLASTVRQYQAIQHKNGSLTVRVVPTPRFDETALEHVLKNCHKYLKGLPVHVERVTDIPPEANGKRRVVVVEK